MENYEAAGHNGGAYHSGPTEDRFTETIESYTASIPSSAYLAVGIGAMALSLACQVAGNGKWGNFIGQWVPTWLLMGLYNKLVKLEGHDHADRTAGRGVDEHRCGFCESSFSSSADLAFHQRNCSARSAVS